MRDFTVYTDDRNPMVVGCCALQFCWEDLAEIRSLAIDPKYLGRGIGSMLMNAVIAEASDFQIKRLFTLTYKPEFFRRFGFTIIDRSALPLKIWADCIICIKFPDCDETAMMKELPQTDCQSSL
jgi:amino-acid N-acetyltransferase